MDEIKPWTTVDHPRGERRLYRLPNGLGASVIPANPAVIDITRGTVDARIIRWTGPGEDDFEDFVEVDWDVVERWQKAVDERGGDVYYGSGGYDLLCVPEGEVQSLLSDLIGKLR